MGKTFKDPPARKAERKAERQWQRTAEKLCDIACEAIHENPADAESEEILKILHPDGHRMAGYVRFMARGPKALLTGGSL